MLQDQLLLLGNTTEKSARRLKSLLIPATAPHIDEGEAVNCAQLALSSRLSKTFKDRRCI